MTDKKRVLVIGAGIIGASIAYHLAKAGVQVTIVEEGQAGGLATRNSWAWINASWGNPQDYFSLRIRAMVEWRRLEREVPGIRLTWCGGLIWDLPPQELEVFAVEHAAWGYGIRRVNRAEALRIEPSLAQPPEIAFHVAEEGSVEPVPATLALIDAAKGLGANVLANEHVRSLDVAAGQVIGIRADSGRCEADEIVIAAGAETATLAATAAFVLPLSAPPGLLVHSKPLARLLNGLVMAPEIHLRQTAQGRLVAGSDFGGGDPGENAEAIAAGLFDRLREMVRAGEKLAFDSYSIGYRPTPGDGFPAIGRAAGIAGMYIAVMHSGITLAPAIGRFAAEEIMTGKRDALLAPYGLERFSRTGGLQRQPCARPKM